eukprot:Opistho-2@46431
MLASTLRSAPLRSVSVTLSRVMYGAHARSMSTDGASPSSSGFTTVQKDAATGIAVLTMNKKPVNSLNLELLTELGDTLKQLESDRSVRGLILASNMKNIFSAGLDIMEMYKPKPDRLDKFWRSLQDAWIALYGTRLATVAAIEGESPAGGCMLAMSCDYRVMAQGGFKIGLNETKLGIVAPFWFIDVMTNTIGHRQSERLLELGAMVGTDEAMRIGLIDEVVAQEKVLTRAREVLSDQFLKIPDVARGLTKQAIRRQTIQKLVERKDQDVVNFAKFATADAVQKSLDGYMEQLKKKKAQ